MREVNRSRRQITFDLNTKSNDFKKSQYDILKRYFMKHNFEHIQGSVYQSKQEFNIFEIHKFNKQMFNELPWLNKVINSIIQTEIGERSSLMVKPKSKLVL